MGGGDSIVLALAVLCATWKMTSECTSTTMVFLFESFV
jgi:hypothetical protein